jgi:hypothetical protein
MSRIVLLLTAITLAGSACGSGEPEPAAPTVPSQAVVRWFSAVEDGDAAAAGAVVVDGSLALVLALENKLTPPQTAEMISSGVPANVATDYWHSFSEGFSDFAGRPIGTLTVGDYREFESEGRRFAAVTVRGSADTSGVVFARQEDDVWAVDLVATLGPGFVGPMQRDLENLPADEHGERIRVAYRDVVAPSLWAALAAGVFDDAFSREALSLLESIDAGA